MEMNWANFRRRFIDHYILESYQLQMERVLNELKQGGMSVVEYTMKFKELVRYHSFRASLPSATYRTNSLNFMVYSATDIPPSMNSG
jgi:hypothetical protein